jgi:two-component SAPR family response regulator
VRFETEVQEEKRLSLRLLGPPEASLEGLPVRFRIKKELALLCYLAAEGGRHSRRELAELLWPESEERNARADLRAVLHKLRKTLRQESAHDGVARFFVIESNRLELEPREIELDLEVFEAAVSLARRETSLGGREEGAPLLESAGSSSAGCKVIWNSTEVSSWKASRSKMPTSSSCGSRVSARGGGRFSGSYARGSLALKGRRV